MANKSQGQPQAQQPQAQQQAQQPQAQPPQAQPPQAQQRAASARASRGLPVRKLVPKKSLVLAHVNRSLKLHGSAPMKISVPVYWDPKKDGLLQLAAALEKALLQFAGVARPK